MANKSSYMLAVLFIANPFMLLFFQNCSSSPAGRAIASTAPPPAKIQVEKPSLTTDSPHINTR